MLNNLISFAQDFKYKKIDKIPEFVKVSDAFDDLNIDKNKFVDVTKYLPNGYVKNGSVDYTEFIQKAINDNYYVLMPNFNLLISDIGLSIPNNRVIIFQDNTILNLKSSDKTNYEIIRIHNKNNITIHSAKIIGDRKSHRNNRGEWGMGISIKASKNIKIINSYISDCWGDGIYIGESNKITSKNVLIKNGFIDNNRRNGISVISVKGLVISDLIVANTNGTNPQSGIVFEPNNRFNILQNISLSNIYSYNNKRFGVLINNSQIAEGKSEVGITLNDIITKYSESGIGYSSIYTNKSSKSIISGKISLKGLSYSNVKTPIKVVGRSKSDKIKISVINNNLSDFRFRKSDNINLYTN